MSEEDRIDDYRKLAGSITNYTDNTCFYEDWLVIQQYVEDWLDELDKYKQVIDKIKEWKKQTLFDLNRQYKTFEYWEELFEDLDKLLEGIE